MPSSKFNKLGVPGARPADLLRVVKFFRVTTLFRVASWAIQKTPRSVSYTGARLIALIATGFASKKSGLIERHLRRVAKHADRSSLSQTRMGTQPSLGRSSGDHQPDMRKSVRRAFINYANYYTDTAVLPGLSPAQIDAGFTFHGWHHVEKARQTGPGPILALPHLGSWEWAGMWLARVARIPVAAVVEHGGNEELFQWMMSFREKLGMHIIPLDAKAGLASSRALTDGYILCLLCDRDIPASSASQSGNTQATTPKPGTSKSGIPVKFFGETTTLPAGPAVLSLRSGAAILPTAVYYSRRHQHGFVMPPIDTTRAGKLRQDIQRVTQDVAASMETLISQAPEQWHLMSPNWPSDQEYLAANARHQSS